MSNGTKDKLLFSLSPEAARSFAEDARAAQRAIASMFSSEMRQAIDSLSGVARLAQVSALSVFTPAPVRAEAKFRLFAISGMALRKCDEAMSPASRVEVAHYAHMKAAISDEQARESELEYMRQKWPESEGWQHTVDLCEVSRDFAGKMLMLGLSGQLETQDADTTQPVPHTLTVDESGIKERGMDEISDAVM
jgi:hypothetical protein